MGVRPWLILSALAVAVMLAAAGAGVHGAGDAVAQTAPPKSGAAPAASPAAAQPGRTPLPAITKGKGDKCVAPTDWMRRFHMTALNHKRDETVHEGIRTPQFSLKACIDCHAVSGADGKAVTVNDGRHFCRSCHDYAAVKVDCFECHASRPEGSAPGKGADSAPNKGFADSAPGKGFADADPHGARAGGAAHAELARLEAALGTYLGDAANAPNGVKGQRQ